MSERPDRGFWILLAYTLLIMVWVFVGKAECEVGTFTAIGSGYTANSYLGADTGSDANYLSARNLTTATRTATSAMRVGQSIVNGAALHVYRTFMAIPITQHRSTVSACTLFVNGALDQSNDDFVIKVVGASAYKSAFDTTDTEMFSGWAASGTYSISALNDDWNSSSYDAGWNAIIFNAAGIDTVMDAMGDTLWIALLSNEDVTASRNTDNEVIDFDSHEDTNKPYLSIEYDPANIDRRMLQETYLWKNGDNTMLWRP